MTSVNAPTARANFQGAALAGTLIVAGGSGPVANCSGSLASAAQYDPSTDVWTTLPSLNSARSQHSIVSSGTAIYAFDGLTDCSNGFTQLGSLESWAPGEAAWTIVNGSNPPAARYAQESTWTGSMLWIYGGASGALSYVTSGSLYDPVQNVWSDASCVLANCARNDGATILDQGYVRLWGGGGGTAPAGLAYEISTGFWAAWTIPANFPATLTNPADDGRRIYLPSGGGSSNLNIVIYDRQTQSQTTDTATSPIDMSSSGAMVWTGAEVVVWSGAGGTAPTSAGGRYQPPAPQE
jgi:hypothetical protein